MDRNYIYVQYDCSFLSSRFHLPKCKIRGINFGITNRLFYLTLKFLFLLAVIKIVYK